jgi:hypothetical protein
LIATVVSALWIAQATAAAPALAPAGRSAEAERLFQQGLKAYDAREFARAIEAFEAAHRLAPLPEIVFDIAMSHRALGDCPRAAKAFDTFIAAVSSSDPLLPRARERRNELGSCAASAADGQPAPPPEARAEAPESSKSAVRSTPLPRPANTPLQPLALVALPAAANLDRGSKGTLWRYTCVASLGSTAVLATAGAIFGWQARSAQQEVENATEWNAAVSRADQRGRAFSDAAAGTLVSAGASALVALTSCLVAR